MNMTPETWICDTCGGAIEKADDGWVEWLLRQSGQKWIGRGLRLVHSFPASPRSSAAKCQYDENRESAHDGSIVNDLALESFLGPDGLMELLSFIAGGELPTLEVLEMIKRLHIPGYEEARFHFRSALDEGVFDPNTREGFYTQSDIKAVLASIHSHP
jgi:hypothetical protein